MPYAGKTIMQREGVALIAPHFPNSKVKATATMVAESRCSIGAWHDNQTVITDLDVDQLVLNIETYEPTTILDPAKGRVRLSDNSIVTVPLTTTWIVSRDCGLYQCNIPPRDINSSYEFTIRTEAMEPETYTPVAKANVKLAYQKWNTPMVRPAGQPQKRMWQPWVAYTSGWAMFPEAWAWHHDKDGEPVGPWVPAGRYLHQAIRAVANWHLLIEKDMDEREALAEAERLAAYFGITKGTLDYDQRHAVYWHYPPEPVDPPSDPAMGYPVKNDGR